MRVIAGEHKGRRLAAPTWPGLRPTSDRLKETVFAILAPRMAGARVLDGFAGTGALGIEALSRGAASVVFIELDSRAAGLVERNLAHCRIADGYVMIRAEFTRALRQLPADLAIWPRWSRRPRIAWPRAGSWRWSTRRAARPRPVPGALRRSGR